MPNREKLISLCERGVVPQGKWYNRDSAGAQIQLGTAWILLKAGCEFRVAEQPVSDKNTWWIKITWRGFAVFDYGGDPSSDIFYIPTEKRLIEAAGSDWY